MHRFGLLRLFQSLAMTKIADYFDESTIRLAMAIWCGLFNLSNRDNHAFYAKCKRYTATKTNAIPKNPMGFSRCLKKIYPPPTVPKMPIAPHSV